MSSIELPSFDSGSPTERVRPESEIPTQKNPEFQKPLETMVVQEKPDWVESVALQTPEQVQVILDKDRDRRSVEMRGWIEKLDLQEDSFDQEAEERIRVLAQQSGNLISSIWEEVSIASSETLAATPRYESGSESTPTDFAPPGRYDDFRLPSTPKPPQFSEEEQQLSDT